MSILIRLFCITSLMSDLGLLFGDGLL